MVPLDLVSIGGVGTGQRGPIGPPLVCHVSWYARRESDLTLSLILWYAVIFAGLHFHRELLLGDQCRRKVVHTTFSDPGIGQLFPHAP